MSCGEPHETDCSEVLSEVWIFLDNECDQKQREILRKHLDECRPCLEQYGIEEHLKVLLARKCGGDHASAEFRDRLRACIKQRVIEQTQVRVDANSVEVRSSRTEIVEFTPDS